ncbi:MAG: type II toxin-antitoxin system VapC family toxin [Planctomycetota bacterium]
MKYILDTCVFIWLCTEPEKLTERVRKICSSVEPDLYLSLASIWELQIKLLSGKFRMNTELLQAVEELKKSNRLRILGITESHVFGLKKLPSIHGDPFDRMLVAQALELNATILTSDTKIAQYPVNVIW